MSAPELQDGNGDRWYVASAGERQGPYTFAELLHLAEVGRLTPACRVWHRSYPDWADAGAVPHLFGRSAAEPVPPAATPRLRPPSDLVPLLVLAGIVLCFVVRFGTRAFEAPAPLAAAGLSRAAVPTDPAAPVYDLEICNRTGAAKVYVTVAYFDPTRADWVARGWFPQASGDCRVVMRHLAPPIFVYGETRDGDARWGEGEPGAEFCIAGEGPFVIGQKGCQKRTPGGRRLQRFQELGVSGAGGVHRWEIGPEGEP